MHSGNSQHTEYCAVCKKSVVDMYATDVGNFPRYPSHPPDNLFGEKKKFKNYHICVEKKKRPPY